MDTEIKESRQFFKLVWCWTKTQSSRDAAWFFKDI